MNIQAEKEYRKKDHTELIKHLRYCLETVKTGDDIRAVFFTMLEQQFTPEEMAEVLDGASITEEKLQEITEKDEKYHGR